MRPLIFLQCFFCQWSEIGSIFHSEIIAVSEKNLELPDMDSYFSEFWRTKTLDFRKYIAILCISDDTFENG